MRRIYSTALFFLFSFTASAQGPTVPSTNADKDAGVDTSIMESLDEAMKKLAIKRNADGLELLKKSKLSKALKSFEDAFELDSNSAEIATNLGYVHFRLGNLKEAERTYREALEMDPDRFATHLNLAELLVNEHETIPRLQEAEQILTRARGLNEHNARVPLYQARCASLLGKFQEAKRFYEEYLKKREPSGKILLEIGDFYLSFGKSDEAKTWYQKVTGDDKFAIEARDRIQKMELTLLAKRYKWSHRREEIPAEAKLLTTKGRVLYRQKKYGQAEQLLNKALTLAPEYTQARIYLGDILRDTGRIDEAEVAYLRAILLDSGNPEIYERLGRLYLSDRDSQRSREAALTFMQALDLKPDWLELRLLLSRALRQSGDIAGALKNVNQYLGEAMPDTEGLAEAQELKRTLEQLISKVVTPGPDIEKGSGSQGQDKRLVEALSLARAHLSRGESGKALAQLANLPDDLKGTAVMNLEARILFASNRLDEAAMVMKKSLSLDDNQKEVHEHLGLLLKSKGDLAGGKRHLKRAEDLGSFRAKFYLSKMNLDEPKGGDSLLLDASRLNSLFLEKRRLESFLAHEDEPSFKTEAGALIAEVDARIKRVFALGAFVLLLIIVLVLFLRSRLFGGKTLSNLLDSHPESGPEVQRVLSAIRHEVLKHNTMVLSGLVEVIESGGDVSKEADHLQKNLLKTGDDSIASKLNEYGEDLKKIGRTYGMRLNLDRKDPAISVIKKGFGDLEKVAVSLKSGFDSLGESQKKSVLKTLKKVAHELNAVGYEEVLGLLGKLRVLSVDKELLISIWDRISKEPGFSSNEFAPLSVVFQAEEPCGVVITKQAFEDVIGNLLRNAIQSSIEDKVAPVEVEIEIADEIDQITGFERVVFQVRDRSRKSLVPDDLRGKNVEQGLGLAMELTSQFDGTMDVVQESEKWSKSVVVKLSRASTDTRQEAK